MKGKTKFLYPIVLALIIALFTLFSSASEDPVGIGSDEDSSAPVTFDATAELSDVRTSEIEEESANTEVEEVTADETGSTKGEITDGSSTDAVESEDTSSEDGNNEANPFEVFFEGVKAYATEILSALTLVASLILAYAYKSGLTPVITNALTNLGKLLGSMRESASENERASKEITEALTERLEAAEQTVVKLTESIEEVTHSLKVEEESTAEKKRLGEILSAQIDMMYSLFISSALPEYQKAAVAERIAEMKEAIANVDK